MSRKILLACTFLVMAVSLAEAAETSQLTADQIVDKSVTARGGLRAWREVQTLSMSGKVDAGGNEKPTPSVQGVRTGGVQMPNRPANKVRLAFRLGLKRRRKVPFELD